MIRMSIPQSPPTRIETCRAFEHGAEESVFPLRRIVLRTAVIFLFSLDTAWNVMLYVAAHHHLVEVEPGSMSTFVPSADELHCCRLNGQAIDLTMNIYRPDTRQCSHAVVDSDIWREYLPHISLSQADAAHVDLVSHCQARPNCFRLGLDRSKDANNPSAGHFSYS